MLKDKFGMVGKPLQHFTLPTSHEELVSTESYVGKKNIVIVLLRDIR